MAFDCHQLSRRNERDFSAREIDLFLNCRVTEDLLLSPLIGLYQPEKWLDAGGLQPGSADTNVYLQFNVWLTI